jgi:hypothetical protein
MIYVALVGLFADPPTRRSADPSLPACVTKRFDHLKRSRTICPKF